MHHAAFDRIGSSNTFAEVFFRFATGADEQGELPDKPVDQIEAVFRKIGLVLAEAGLTFGHLVEMTSYHVGLRDHLDDFKKVRAKYVTESYPAWTAIGVSGFVSEGAFVEVRCIARR